MENILLEDVAKLAFVSAPTLGPDGKLLAYTVTTSDRENNCYQANIHLCDTQTGATRALGDTGKDGAFLWDDADTLLVCAEYDEADKSKPHNKKTSYYRVCVSTGKKAKAFDIPGEVTQLKKLEKGLYAATIVYDKNAPDPSVVPEDECIEELDYHVIEEAPLWENGKGYVSGKRNVLYLYNEAQQSLTPVTNFTTEVKSFQISGSLIAIVGKDWQDTLQDTLTELYLYHADTGKTETIVPPATAKVGQVGFVGSKLIYTLSDNKTYGNTQLCDFYTYDPAAGQSAFLCAHNGLAVGGSILTDVMFGDGTTWKTVGEEIFFVALKGYERALYSIDLAGTVKKRVCFEEGCIAFFDADEGTVYAAAAPKDRCLELYRCPLDGGLPVKLTDVNGDFFEKKFVSPVKYTPFVNSEGISIDGWVIYPKDYDETKRYPALYEIHGGPRSAYGCVFMHEMQAFASKGYFVFFCNPRGSEGKGEEFADIRGKHGTIDYDDLMAFMDHILEVCPQIDPKRVAVAGGSYAGFMCNWIVGHTDRFAAIASQRSVSDFVADFCISDIGFTYDREAAGGDPWNNTEKLWFHSPYRYAPYAKTPILFIHALCDYDCTIDQGVEMFQAMKYFGVPSRMCLFEGENHNLSRNGKPRHRIRRLREIAAWIDRYC